MAVTNNLGITFNGGAQQLFSAAIAASDTDQASFDGTIAATTSNRQINIAFPYANIALAVLYSDQALTLYTNATDGTGGNSFTLAAGVPVLWYPGCGYTNPFTHDVTKMYGNNAGSTAANLKVYVLCH